MTEQPSDRRPRWVYQGGDEPDYRFSFANERTYLAWLRTALALMAAGVAIDVLIAPAETAMRALATLLVVLGMLSATLAVVRWARAERAMRHSHPLPGFSMVAVIPLALIVTGVLLWVLL